MGDTRAGKLMSSFTKTAKGLLVHLDEMEVPVLRQTATEVLGILADGDTAEAADDPLARMVGISTNDTLPENPILARLFPNAYEDDQLSSEFRRYTETSLHDRKQRAITNLLGSLPLTGEASIELDLEMVDQWMRAINDLRLALGVVLVVDENSEERFAKLSEVDPVLFTYQVFNWLGWLLENLIENAMD
jgi:hypothetical protein